MTPETTVMIVREAMALAVTSAGPLIVTALVIGLTVSIFQATTQINEPTLSFAPKAIGVGAVFAIFAPYITGNLVQFIQLSFERAAQVLTPGGF